MRHVGTVALLGLSITGGWCGCRLPPAAVPSVSFDGGVDAPAEVADAGPSEGPEVSFGCIAWKIDPDDGSLNMVPVACPTEEDQQQEILDEIRQRSGLQRF